MQSVYDINHLVREARYRWLKPVEVYFILQNYEEHQLKHQVPQKPAGGSLYLFNKRVLKFFRKDGHSWRRRKDQRTIAEAHERLKVGNAEALNCYYAHGEENPKFQRRSYWMLDPEYEHIVLVHYRDITEGRQNTRSTTPQSSPLSSYSISPTPNSSVIHQQDSSLIIQESYELHPNESSPASVENIASGETDADLSQALRMIQHQLSLDDAKKESNVIYFEDEDSNLLEAMLRDSDWSGDSGQTPYHSEKILLQQSSDETIQQKHQILGVEVDFWEEIIDSSKSLQNLASQTQFGGENAQNSSMIIPQEVESMKYSMYSPVLNDYGISSNCYSTLLNQDDLEIPLEQNISLTIAQKQKFTIQEICPEWCYTSEGAKIVIIGSFLCDPSDSSWACMFGEIEVPIQIIKEGVILCHAPPYLQGKVNLCITSGNRESCSEVKEFEYRAKSSICTQSKEDTKSSEELSLLIKFAHMLLSDFSLKGNVFNEVSWSQIIDTVLSGTSTLSSVLDWLVQELLQDKLELWLNQKGYSLSKKEQGILHMVAGLGFVRALQPILNSGVSVNFRDCNGWTALHWAAKFGREKTVAALLALGASAGAITDPNSNDPTGKTPASIAAAFGHKGLAGYLSEASLTSHLSSLTLEESELSKGSAELEAERTVNSLSKESSSMNEDQVSLRDTLDAVRNSAQAAARIQSAFRAHSFRKRQQKEAELDNEIRELVAASKLTFGGSRDYNLSALSIQKNYRGWKGRKEFLALRQKVVKIQAHVRGYQVRKYYKVCWAVGVLEKVVLRWRRRGVGLRGFQLESEFIDENEDEEDILRVFRKQKVDPAIDEAVSRVLSMVESPQARQQYRRILEKYRQAKAELKSAESDVPSSSRRDIPCYDLGVNMCAEKRMKSVLIISLVFSHEHDFNLYCL